MSSSDQPAIAPAGAVEAPSKSLGHRFLKNTAALVIGWNLSAAGRLLTARFIVRGLGTTVFGEYALLVVWLMIAEWILDFGTTEVFVREANQNEGRRNVLVRIFLALKIVQAPLAMLVLLAGLLAMHYPRHILVAGALASSSLIFTAGIALCRAIFKSTLTMEREVAAEFVSVMMMIPAILLVIHFRLGLTGLMGTYVLSRGIFLCGCLAQSRKEILFSVRGVQRSDIRWGIISSYEIGVIGFVVVLYNAVDLLVLSRTASLSSVAVYSAAQRFTIPLTMVLNAIAVSVYPVLALLKSPERFRKACQRAVDHTILLGCLALVCLWCGAEFFMNLLGPELVSGSDALRILVVVCVIKAIPLVIGPALFLVRAQRYALGYMLAALAFKVVVTALLSVRFGYIGAAVGSLCAEAFFLMPVSMYFVYVFTGFKASFNECGKIVFLTVVVVVTVRTLLPHYYVAAAVFGAVLFVALILAARVIRPSELRTLLRWEGT